MYATCDALGYDIPCEGSCPCGDIPICASLLFAGFLRLPPPCPGGGGGARSPCPWPCCLPAAEKAAAAFAFDFVLPKPHGIVQCFDGIFIAIIIAVVPAAALPPAAEEHRIDVRKDTVQIYSKLYDPLNP